MKKYITLCRYLNAACPGVEAQETQKFRISNIQIQLKKFETTTLQALTKKS
jgi:hypothetical protein